MLHLVMMKFTLRNTFRTKHIEIQIIGDGKGNAIHLAEEIALFKEDIKKY